VEAEWFKKEEGGRGIDADGLKKKEEGRKEEERRLGGGLPGEEEERLEEGTEANWFEEEEQIEQRASKHKH